MSDKPENLRDGEVPMLDPDTEDPDNTLYRLDVEAMDPEEHNWRQRNAERIGEVL